MIITLLVMTVFALTACTGTTTSLECQKNHVEDIVPPVDESNENKEDIKTETDLYPTTLAGNKYVFDKIEYSFTEDATEEYKNKMKTDAISVAKGEITENSTNEEVLAFFSVYNTEKFKNWGVNLNFADSKCDITFDGQTDKVVYIYNRGTFVLINYSIQFGNIEENNISAYNYSPNAVIKYTFILQK